MAEVSVPGLVSPMRVEGVFDDPGAIRRLVQHNGPYPTMASFLPASAVRGRGEMAGAGVPPHFRATWASGGRPLVDGAEVILHNPRLLRAAARLFDAEVVPNTVAVNIGTPQPAGAVHVDVPSFSGADRDRYPMKLLQAMAASGLFEYWRIPEAGAVWWSYSGVGGAYDYWPDGLEGPMRSERPPFGNIALVADNNRMYHRIGQIGDPADAPRNVPVGGRIDHHANGWVVSGKPPLRYHDRDIRISVLWKAQVRRPGPATSLTPGLITSILSEDLARRGLPAGSMSDDRWLDQVHSAYYSPV